jgi:hypothetical protein
MVADLVKKVRKVDKKNKYPQSVNIWHSVTWGCPMIDFEDFKVLFQFLKVDN